VGQLDAPDSSVSAVRVRRARVLAAALALASTLAPGGDARAHINSPDLLHEGMAGRYRLLVTIRPPEVIPGVAAIEVLATRADLHNVTLVPLPIRGPGAISPPVADIAARSPDDPRRFEGRLWLMATGSWQVRVHVEGPDGAGDLSVPIPAIAVRTRRMQAGLGALLLALLAFLVAGLVSIIGASVRDADLAEGAAPDRRRRRRGHIAQIVTAGVLVAGIAGGWWWWDQEASFYGRLVYKPLALEGRVTAAAPGARGATGGGGETGAAAAGAAEGRQLALTLTDPGWLPMRRLDDLLPDHGHLMHLFVVRLPGLDAIAHLHPTESAPGHFTQPLPPLPPGAYALFADIVHGNGFAETATSTVEIVAGTDAAPTGDDAVGTGAPIAPTTAAAGTRANEDPIASLADGTRVVWRRERAGDAVAPLVAGRASWFRFHVEERPGAPARDLVPYMGMAGHAVFLTHDRSVFAHVHPTGSVPMAALALVAAKGADPHAGHAMPQEALPAEIAFPYVCPRPGDYRIFVQFRRGPIIETAIFDAHVDR
jgi:hypothetical protein